MPHEVSRRQNDTSKVKSPSSNSFSTNASSNLSSDGSVPEQSLQLLETSDYVDEPELITPPSSEATGNSSTETLPQSPKAPENSTNPPKHSPPPPSTDPPENSSSIPPPDSDPLLPPPPLPPPPPPPPPPGLPKLRPPPQDDFVDEPPSVSPPPPKTTLPSPPFLTPPPPPPSLGTGESSNPPLLSPTPPLLSPPSTSGIAVSPTPLLSPLPPSGTSLVPPQTPTSYVLNNTPKNSNSEGDGIHNGGAVAIGLTISFLLLGSIGIAVWCLCLRKKKYSKQSSYLMPTSLVSSPASDSELLKMQHSSSNTAFDYSATETGGLGNSRSMYTYKELTKATNQFAKKNLLGEGGFGLVYKGRLPDGREVAVKQLKEGGSQGEREFRAEVETISHVHHKHLVSLIGYCIFKRKRLLIYDYVPNSTVHFHLHEKGDGVLDWAARFKIALGTARGIAYLHEYCHPRIIHRDIKSSNILLNNNFEAQVSDFGLARLFADSYTHVTTRVMGTFGYMAPEYALSGKLTDKSDVFSFGVVLLELITGRKPVDSSQPPGEESLVEWARPLLNIALESEEFEALVDPRLENNYVDCEMFCMIEAAASCVRHLSSKRPRMIQVVRAFDSMIVVPDLTNGMRLGESKMFDATQESAELRLLQDMAFGGQNYSTGSYTQGTWKSED